MRVRKLDRTPTMPRGFEFIFPLTPRDTRSLGPVHIEGNGGRLGPEYVMSQVGRMREAFLLFGGR